MVTKKKEGWLQERLDIKESVDKLLYRKVPRGVGWWYTLGSATLVTFILLVLSGAFLMMNYSPSLTMPTTVFSSS